MKSSKNNETSVVSIHEDEQKSYVITGVIISSIP